jgi:predicted CDP-diglyceride synthetase/phosphatidate cytidylyltransferase
MAIALLDERIRGLLFIVFVASWVIIGLTSFIYFRYHKNLELKKRVHTWSGIAYGISFVILVAVTTTLTLGLVSIGPIALITYLAIRDTIFCSVCGRAIYTHSPFIVWWHGWRCGAQPPYK